MTIRDNDTPGLLITEVTPGTSTQDDASLVIEGKNDPAAGGAYTGRNDEILVHLATDPGAGVTVVVGLILDAASAQAVIVSSADPRWNAADLTLTFTGGPSGTWDDADPPADPCRRRQPRRRPADRRPRVRVRVARHVRGGQRLRCWRTCAPASRGWTSRSSTTRRRAWS